MYRHEPRLAELRPPDGEDPFLKIDVLAIEAQGFADPHPGHREQSVQRRVREGPTSERYRPRACG